MQIQISWLLQKPTDLDLHCLQSISGFSMTRVKRLKNIVFVTCMYLRILIIPERHNRTQNFFTGFKQRKHAISKTSNKTVYDKQELWQKKNVTHPFSPISNPSSGAPFQLFLNKHSKITDLKNGNLQSEAFQEPSSCLANENLSYFAQVFCGNYGSFLVSGMTDNDKTTEMEYCMRTRLLPSKGL